jgi:superfamily II DNA/RNA helicase
MDFKELGLSDNYNARLKEQNIVQATEIQTDLFGPIVKGESVLGLSKTGTGKTLSYIAPLVERYSSRLLDQAKSDASQTWVWVLVPTRELATQVRDTYALLTHAQSQVAVVVGGESEENQIAALSRARFVVATPGRLLDLLRRKRLATRDVEVVVMDEADRLLDMGFVEDIRQILSFLEKRPQLICVSATLHLGVEEVAYELGIEPLRFGNAEAMPTVEGLDHRVSFVGDDEKFHVLTHFIHQRKDLRGIVFSNYRERAHGIASRLAGLGYKVDALSAQLPQNKRSQIVEAYRTDKLKILVGSDLAARGLDFMDLDYVVNYDLSEDPSTYVHRVGRTARAGRKGRALSLVGYEDAFRLEKLEKFLGIKIPVEEIPVEQLSGPLPRFAPRPQPQARPQRENRQHAESPRSQQQPKRHEARSQVVSKTPASRSQKNIFSKCWSFILGALGIKKTSAARVEKSLGGQTHRKEASRQESPRHAGRPHQRPRRRQHTQRRSGKRP